jgi:hypothetical protein
MLIFAMHQKQKIPVKYYFTGIFFVLQFFPAERQGFEPRVPRSTTVFKTAAIDHSATSPKTSFSGSAFLFKAVQRYKSFLILQTSFLFFHELIVLLHHDISAGL